MSFFNSNSIAGRGLFQEPVPKLDEILFHDAQLHGTETPQWMLRMDEIFTSTIEVKVEEAKTNYLPCYGYKMYAKRHVSGSRLTQNYVSSSCHHSRIWFVVPLEKSTPSLFIKLHDGTIIKKTQIVRLANIGSEYNKPLWQASFDRSHLEYVEIIKDYVMIALSVDTGEQTIFAYEHDGSFKGRAVSSFDYATNTGEEKEKL